jgi:hypothetical protein
VRVPTSALTLAVVVLLPSLAAAQSAPLADALRKQEESAAKNLTAAAEEFPADKYGYKPTPAQMPFGKIVTHLAQGNDFFCGTIAGVKAPDRSKVDSAAAKDVLVGRLKETFDFCTKALANLDDSNLGEQLKFFGGRTVSRAEMEMVTAADWQDHYSQSAIYLRLNGLLPPTAQPKKPAA